MCGILGFYQTKQAVNPSLFLEALTLLKHRGPDGQGVWQSKDQHIGLGHTRLSIMDEVGGAQPLFNKEQSIHAVVNGEFYDYKQLRQELEAKGHQFTTNSDSELIIHLYQEYDLDCVQYLRGEFAFVLFDQRKNRLFAARDRFGIKPLCYSYSDEGVVIASEAKALFKLGVQPNWSEYALYHTFCFQYLPVNQTLFKDVHSIPAGTMLLYDGRDLLIKSYWDLNYQDAIQESADFSSLSQQLDMHLREAIKVRLNTDNASLCCHLSGGVDSASIAAIASELAGSPIPCFSVAFPHDEYNELPFAEALAKKIGAPFHPVFVDAENIVSALPDAVYYSEGLAINNHLAAKFILNREIKKAGFKVALTGEGSDELFAGYIHLQEDFLPQARPHSIVSGIHTSNDPTFSLDAIQEKLKYIPTFIKAKAAVGYKIQGLLEHQPFDTNLLVKDSFLNEQIHKSIGHLHPVHQATYLWVKFALSGYILKTLGDGCEMAHGIEGRVPFLDHHLFNFAKRIPLAMKIKLGTDKFILRETVKKYLTPEIAQRKKQPFIAPPFSMLQNKSGYEFMCDCLQSNTNIPFLNRQKMSVFMDEIPKKSIPEQIAAEPVMMLLLTASLLGQKYGL
jgi:asparagine synthase (glutamine-hydrolysing)